MNRLFTTILSQRLQSPLPFIQVVTGPRQVGKTTGVQALRSEFKDALLYHTADLPSPPDADWITQKWQEARAKVGRVILVLDEVQKIRRWSEVVKLLFDEDRHRTDFSVVILGSASLLMQDGLTESLLGRFELIKVPHWTFAEHETAFGWNLDQFLQFGGYPAPTALIGDVDRWQAFMRDAVLEPMLSKDLLALRNVSKIALLRQTISLALTHPSQELSFNKMLGQLNDAGNTVTIKSYLELLESAFIIKLLYKFSTRLISTKSSSPKLLPLAPALIHAYQSPLQINSDPAWFGRVFESAIGSHLLNISKDLYYWREGNHEIDFVITKNNETIGIEVKSNKTSASSGAQKFRQSFPNAKMVFLTIESGKEFLRLPYDSDLWGFLKSLSG